MADRHKFPAVTRLSRRLLDRSEKAIFTYPTCIWRPRVTPLEFDRDVWQKKTSVPGRSYGVVCVIMCLAVFGTVPACDEQTDGRTDGHAMTADTVLAWRRKGKMYRTLSFCREQ